MTFTGPSEKLKITEDSEGILFEVIPQRRKVDFLLAGIPVCFAIASAFMVDRWSAKLTISAFFIMLSSVFFFRTGASLFVASEGLGDSKKKLIRWDSVYRLIYFIGAGDDKPNGLYVEGPFGSIGVLSVATPAIAEEVLIRIHTRFPNPDFAWEPETNYPFGLGSGQWGEFTTLGLNQTDSQKN